MSERARIISHLNKALSRKWAAAAAAERRAPKRVFLTCCAAPRALEILKEQFIYLFAARLFII